MASVRCEFAAAPQGVVCVRCGRTAPRNVVAQCRSPETPLPTHAPQPATPCGTCGQPAANPKPPDELGRPRRLPLPPLAAQAGGLARAAFATFRKLLQSQEPLTDRAERARRHAACERCELLDRASQRCTACGCFRRAAVATAAKDCADPAGSRWSRRVEGPRRIVHAGHVLAPPESGPGLRVAPFAPNELAVAVLTAPRPRPTLRDTLHGLRRAAISPEMIFVFAEPSSPPPGELDGFELVQSVDPPIAQIFTERESSECSASQSVPSVQSVDRISLRQNPTRLGCFPNWIHAARTLLQETDSPWLLLCEDDCELCDAAGAALAHALRTLDRVGCVSLYSPLHNLGPSQRPVGWFPTNRAFHTWGALAWCFPRAVLEQVVKKFAQHCPSEATDQHVALAVAEQGLHFYSHFPSLGKHIGESSSLGHTNKPEFRALGYNPSYDGYRFADAPLRVSFLTPNLLCGGVERWLQSLVAHADPQRIEWRVWLANENAQEPAIVEALAPHALLSSGAEALAWTLRTSDVLIAWGLPDLPQLVAGTSRPVVLVSHGGAEHAWTRNMLRAALPAATHCAAVSAAAAAAFPSQSLDPQIAPNCTDQNCESQSVPFVQSVPSVKSADRSPFVRVIPNGYVPARLFHGRDRATVRRAWNLPTEEIAIGYVGRLSQEKQPQAIAAAVAELRRQERVAGGTRKYRAVFVGPQYDARLVQTIRRQSPDALFIEPVEHVGEVYAALDCGLCASASEGFCLSNLEMLAVGLPLVSCSVGFLLEWERVHGPLCVPIPPHASPGELAAAVRLALSPARRHVIEYARQVALPHTAEASARAWETFLSQLVAPPAALRNAA